MPESMPRIKEAKDRDKLRLSMLRDTCLFNHPDEQEYEEFVVAAAAMADTEVALVSLIDSQRQWFKATVCIEVNEIAHCVSFCTESIGRQNGWLVVDDTLDDPRFADHPLVIGGPRIRFLAGMPIRVTGQQVTIGTLCVVDARPRTLAPDRLLGLRALGRILENFITAKIGDPVIRAPRLVM